MKRLLLTLAAALLFLNTFVIPLAHADGGGDGDGCDPNVLCKP